MEHADRIVMWGMSCVGKTTFAKTIDRPYYCFDAMFRWHDIETLGLSIDANLTAIQQECEKQSKFVLDGWHLADSQGQLLPKEVVIYVVYASYEQIVRQYRVAVDHFDQHREMFKQWYDIRFPARYFLNQDGFVETSREDFIALTNTNL